MPHTPENTKNVLNFSRNLFQFLIFMATLPLFLCCCLLVLTALKGKEVSRVPPTPNPFPTETKESIQQERKQTKLPQFPHPSFYSQLHPPRTALRPWSLQETKRKRSFPGFLFCFLRFFFFFLRKCKENAKSAKESESRRKTIYFFLPAWHPFTLIIFCLACISESQRAKKNALDSCKWRAK